ncbi:MAG: hypothetical protein Q8M94_21790 [Ignavibacteria bacterium]|nr:hypothetical protein [Ignavibacteria bacterium]
MKTNIRFYYLFIVIVAVLIATLIKLYFRPCYPGNNHFYKLLLGSLPNFFYVLGFSFIYPLFKGSISFKQHVIAVFFITLGTIAYEIEQLWTERNFDYLDVIASITAAVIAIVLYQKVFLITLKNSPQTIE